MEAPNWWRVSDIARALLERSKDLRVATYLLRAMIAADGLAGLARGLYVVLQLLRVHWNCLYPQLEGSERDPTARLNALAALADRDALLREVGDIVLTRTTKGSLTVRELTAAMHGITGGISPTRETDDFLVRMTARDPDVLAALSDAVRVLSELKAWLAEQVGNTTVLEPLSEILRALTGISCVEEDSSAVSSRPYSRCRDISLGGRR